MFLGCSAPSLSSNCGMENEREASKPLRAAGDQEQFEAKCTPDSVNIVAQEWIQVAA